MYRICLINMPFSNLALPSIALTQLKARIDELFPGQVSVEIVYLSHDFAKYLGVAPYSFISNSMESLNTGLGDWFFRRAAFPEQPDNTAQYVLRYFPGHTPEMQQLKVLLGQKLPGLDTFMDQLISKYKLDTADIGGFTSMFMQNTASLAMARKLKQRNPKLITIMGGANCEFPMGGVLAKQAEFIDYVFSGPGLKSFPEFVQHCLEGNLSQCGPIRGVFARGTQLPVSGPETIGEDLQIDTPVKLDYDSFLQRLEKYFPNGEVQPVLSLETSRGCWWGERAHCTFCGLNGVSMGYRAMKPELAIELFHSLFHYAGKVKRLSAVDNILPKSYLADVLPYLETPPDMEIFYEVKADLSEQDVAVLAKAGVTQIQPGIEALATSTLKLMKKGTTVFQNLKLLKLCALYEVQPNWNLLVGFPGEDEEVYRKYVEVLPLLAHFYPPSGAYPVRFDRFSPYFYEAGTYKLDLAPLDFYSLIYPFSKEDLKDLAYYFADRNITAPYFTTMAKWLGKMRAAVEQWQARWKQAGTARPPSLHFKENSDVVYDSRSGNVIEHALGVRGKAVLEHLAKPTRMEELSKVFSSENGFDISVELASLQSRGLVFQENDRFMSLVLEGEHGSKRSKHWTAHSVPVEQLREQLQVQ